MRKFKATKDNYKFRDILDICKDNCLYFTLTEQDQLDHKKENPIYNRFLKDLSPNFIKQFKTPLWFDSYTHPINPYKISIFILNEKTKAILSYYIDYLFHLDNNGGVLDLPEDICFFREDNTLFLGTRTHCSFAVFYLTDQETQTITLPDGFEEKPEIHFTAILPI